MPEQITLIPESPPTFADDLIPLDELPPDEELVGREPDAAMIASVERYGVLEPIIVVERGDRYDVADGRRRVRAARKAGLGSVPARITGEGDGWMGQVITVTTHANRAANPMAEFDAIRELVAAGADEKAVARATGMPIGTVRKRMALASLHPELAEAARAGRIAASTAEQAAKLSDEIQQRLVAVLAERGKLTVRDVREARMVQREEAVSALPFDRLVPDDDPEPEGDHEPFMSPEPTPLERACQLLIEGLDGGADLASLAAIIQQIRELVRGGGDG